jgi:ribA/ribD-fused uncharacterized protein
MGGSGIANKQFYPILDNFYKCQFTYDGMTWNSSEQLYQALKFKDKEYRKKINQETEINMIYYMGQSEDHELIDNFEEKKVDLMLLANYQKFNQNEELQKVLISTFPHSITFLGSTEFWNKKNSKILVTLRKYFIEKKSNK